METRKRSLLAAVPAMAMLLGTAGARAAESCPATSTVAERIESTALDSQFGSVAKPGDSTLPMSRA